MFQVMLHALTVKFPVFDVNADFALLETAA
jgi:hypothetical protein